ncbi:MAG: glucokinase [Betaproteobacteria bacterium]|nr:glucokinase [Betaproteobacteria bacterium]
MSLLVGDIGGTHTRLALAEPDAPSGGCRITLRDVTRYENARYPDLDAILAEYLSSRSPGRARTGCLAVAGPTDGRRVRFTNLGWELDANCLSERHGLAGLRFINDFSAVGWGLAALEASDLSPLQVGRPSPRAPRVAVGAGTGLGVSLCVWQDRGYRPLASEGGHIGFAPVNAEQDRLLAFLRRTHGRVSVERLVSGPGLCDIYRFCLAEAGRREEGDACLSQPDAARAVSQTGLAPEGPAEAQRALALFVRLYGQVAGDIALLTRAAGGVYLAGGIAPQILTALHGAGFLLGFRDKGRFSAWMEEAPVAVALAPDIGLRGAAVAAENEAA